MVTGQNDVFHEGATNPVKKCATFDLSTSPVACALPLASSVALNRPPILHKAFSCGGSVGLTFLE